MKTFIQICVFFVLTTAIRAQDILVSVRNPSTSRQPGVVVELGSKTTASAKELSFDGCIVRDEATGSELVSQTVDENGDGIADVFLFQADFKPEEVRRFHVVKGIPSKKIDSLTDARFVLPREDLAWENDRIAFRMYGPAMAKDVNNGVDVWTKRVRYRIVEKWYKQSEGSAPGKDTYHIDNGEGADFFSVGRTLGAGGSAILVGDSLVQPGVFASYKIIATGPIRAQFELTYNPVQVNGTQLTETRRITLDAGSNLNRMEVTYRGEGTQELTFVAGIVKRAGVVATLDEDGGWVALWGSTNDSPENGFLGTGVVMPKASVLRVKENAIHALIIGKTKVGTTTRYYSGFGWTRMGDVTTSRDWNAYLAEQAMHLQAPLRITARPK
jgi:pectinesterase